MAQERLLVVNIPGTTGEVPPYGESWLAWSRAELGSARARCDVLGCAEPAKHGAHVVTHKTGIAAIAGMCTRHNHPSNRAPMPLKHTAAPVLLPGERKRLDAQLARLTRSVEREAARAKRDRELGNAIGTAALTVTAAAAGAAVAKHNDIDPVLGGLFGAGVVLLGLAVARN